MRIVNNSLRLEIALVCLMSLLWLMLLPRPAAALPPRPGGDQQSTSSGDGQDGNEGAYDEAWARANGAFIELHVRPAQPGVWTVVQWQNGTGDWADVEGWQGLLEGDKKAWWVSRDILSKGPFQWVVYADEKRATVLGSQPFYLPSAVGEIQRVDMLLSSPAVSPTATIPPSEVQPAPSSLDTLP